MNGEFAKRFESSVLKTVREYPLASGKDRVLVACSGGKDSTSVLSILASAGYRAEALHIDLGMGEWSMSNKNNLRSFCRERGIALHITSSMECLGHSVCYLKSTLKSKAKLNSCFVCGVLKKWILNRKARELGADVLATGHNLDDEARTLMMNLANGNPGLCLLSGPIRGKGGELMVPRVKPLYFMTAKEIERYSRTMGFPVLYERCPCSKGSFGRSMYGELEVLESAFPGSKMNFVRTFLGLQKGMKSGGSAVRCRHCGEPSRKGVCSTCSMMLALGGEGNG